MLLWPGPQLRAGWKGLWGCEAAWLLGGSLGCPVVGWGLGRRAAATAFSAGRWLSEPSQCTSPSDVKQPPCSKLRQPLEAEDAEASAATHAPLVCTSARYSCQKPLLSQRNLSQGEIPFEKQLAEASYSHKAVPEGPFGDDLLPTSRGFTPTGVIKSFLF